MGVVEGAEWANGVGRGAPGRNVAEPPGVPALGIAVVGVGALNGP